MSTRYKMWIRPKESPTDKRWGGQKCEEHLLDYSRGGILTLSSGLRVVCAADRSHPTWLLLSEAKDQGAFMLYPRLIEDILPILSSRLLQVILESSSRRQWLVCPIPPHRDALQRRELSPPELFSSAVTRQVKKMLGRQLMNVVCHDQTVAHCTQSLSRDHQGQRQRTLSRQERLQAQVGSMTARPLRGRAVILIDDVVTTGGTLIEGVRALSAAGAIEVVPAALFAA